MMAEWYVNMDGEEMGPYSLEVLKKLADSKQLGSTHLVWKEGMADWINASDVPELKGRGDIPKIKVKSMIHTGPPAHPPAPVNYGMNAHQMPNYQQNYTPESYLERQYTQNSSIGEPSVSVGDWALTLLVISIPIANIVLLAIWALDKNTNESKRNFAKAVWLWVAIGFGIYAVFFLFLLAVVNS